MNLRQQLGMFFLGQAIGRRVVRIPGDLPDPVTYIGIFRRNRDFDGSLNLRLLNFGFCFFRLFRDEYRFFRRFGFFCRFSFFCLGCLRLLFFCNSRFQFIGFRFLLRFRTRFRLGADFRFSVGFRLCVLAGERSTVALGRSVFISSAGGSRVSQKYTSFSPARYSSSTLSIKHHYVSPGSTSTLNLKASSEIWFSIA